MGKFIGKYEAGEPSGPCWLKMKGGAWLHGEVTADWKLCSENGSYLYPDLETGYNGVFRDSVMVRGRAAVLEAAEIVDTVMRIKVTKIWGPEREFREATEDCLSTHPLLRKGFKKIKAKKIINEKCQLFVKF